jgi:hypothetical protein
MSADDYTADDEAGFCLTLVPDAGQYWGVQMNRRAHHQHSTMHKLGSSHGRQELQTEGLPFPHIC